MNIKLYLKTRKSEKHVWVSAMAVLNGSVELRPCTLSDQDEAPEELITAALNKIKAQLSGLNEFPPVLTIITRDHIKGLDAIDAETAEDNRYLRTLSTEIHNNMLRLYVDAHKSEATGLQSYLTDKRLIKRFGFI